MFFNFLPPNELPISRVQKGVQFPAFFTRTDVSALDFPIS
jgi:hypothetical protein